MIQQERRVAIYCVDLFCGTGGLTYGLQNAGIEVLAGLDVERKVEWPYEENTGARFVHADLMNYPLEDIRDLYPELGRGDKTMLAGCAPCQPFSSYGRTRKRQGERQVLVERFADAIEAVQPDIVTMENVPPLTKHASFAKLLDALDRNGYSTKWKVVDCADYGVPQHRKRLVMIAGRGEEPPFPEPLSRPAATVKDAIYHLPPIEAGETHPDDPLHKASGLSELNLRRIRASKPGGTWLDWPEELRSPCHRRSSGSTYKNVYARMEWDKPSPTITTQFNGFGTGRFGHPEQDRAISLREGALLQSFPEWWRFVSEDDPIEIEPIARAIGNAVPPLLAEAIGECIVKRFE